MKFLANNWLAILAILLFIAVFSIFGHDADHAESNAKEYCARVFHGEWPDFKNHFEKYCDGPNHKH